MMKNSYLLCVIGLISFGISPSSQANIPSLLRPLGYPGEIDVNSRLDWTSELNITRITSDNDPDTQLILHLNATQIFSLPGIRLRELNLQSTRNLTAFETATETFLTQVTGNWTGDNNVTFTHTVFSAQETIQRTIDFSDYTKRSKVNYSVVFQTEMNITFPAEAPVELVLSEHPDLKQPQDGIVGLLPLVNSTGRDFTSCVETLCTSNTHNDFAVTKYYPFGNVIVLASKQIRQNVTAQMDTDEKGNQLYYRLSSIRLDYYVMIGQHTC